MKRSAVCLVLLLSAAGVVCQAGAQEQPETVKVNVRLVNIFATVVDEHGAPLAGLKKEDFQILEDGEPQNVAVFDRESEAPLSIVLAVDTSLSTRKDLKLELEAARRFLQSILRPQDALSLYEFKETVRELTPFTSDLARIDRGLQRMQPSFGTALFDALYLGSQALESRQGRKVLVIISDGGDTTSKVKYAEAVRAAQQSEAIVYSIIIVPIAASAGRNTGGEHALIQISADTGGKYYYASSIPRLDQAFQQISDELRTQYLLAYYPTRRLSDSDFRRIEVKVKQPATAALPVPAACRVTLPNGSQNPGELPSCAGRRFPNEVNGFRGNHGNGKLWVTLPADGKFLITPEEDGSLGQKIPWWRGVCGRLTITGRRLDAPAGPLRASVPEGYGEAGFQASGAYFPSEGCWEITGRAGDAELTFVAEVQKEAELGSETPLLQVRHRTGYYTSKAE